MNKFILKSIISFENFLKKPIFRYSRIATHFRELFSYRDTEKSLKLGMSFLDVNGIKGDYAEFGVYDGASFIPAYHFSKLLKRKDMKFYAFDSFEGLPDPSSIDKEFSWAKGDFNCSLSKFKSILKKSNVDLNKVVFVKGFYNKTLNKSYGIKRLAFVHIDCDYYSSTKEVLNYIKPYLQEGTVLLFDDYYCFKGNAQYGEQRAFNEFRKANPELSFIDLPGFGLRKIFICGPVDK